MQAALKSSNPEKFKQRLINRFMNTTGENYTTVSYRMDDVLSQDMMVFDCDVLDATGRLERLKRLRTLDANGELEWLTNAVNGVQQDKRKVAWMTRAAQQSDAAAQAELALMYLDGEGVQQDSKKAAELYTKAAEQGNTVAQKMLAGMYFGGEGVPQDKKKAAELYRQAAEQGDAEA